MRHDPCPLPSAAPFGVDVHAEDLERAYTPGAKCGQRVVQNLAGGRLTCTRNPHGRTELLRLNRQCRQRRERDLPRAYPPVAGQGPTATRQHRMEPLPRRRR